MSLTSFIKQTEVRKKFREQFPKPGFNIKKQLLFPPLTKNYMEVGAAFDYLFRFGLKRNNPKAAERRWVAELALRDMPGFTLDLVTDKSYFEPDWEIIGSYVHTRHPQLFPSYLPGPELTGERFERVRTLVGKVCRDSEKANRVILEAKKKPKERFDRLKSLLEKVYRNSKRANRIFLEAEKKSKKSEEKLERFKSLVGKVYQNCERANRVILEAKSSYSHFLKSGRLTKHLIKSAIFLARLDGKLWGSVPVEKLDLDNVDEKDITDLRNLIKAVNWDDFKAKKNCLLNPTFGEASRLVGGADADVVIDDTLIEIKTTKKCELKRDYFNQLIGYYCLYCIDGVDGLPKKRRIKNFAIYFSRQAYLHVLPLNQCIDNQRFTEFFEWFKDKVENYAKR